MTFLRALLAALSLLVTLAQPAFAALPEGTNVEVSVAGDGYLELNGRRYRGPIRITAESDGVAVVEVSALDTYLEGIREVPFSWHEESLAAQAVAARTYLAWTLSGGRTETGRRIGYDICATAACQVYAGVDPVLGEDGDRWREAVARTSGEILVYEGAPARAFYSSTTGGRTRNIEDIWPGSTPAPYLVGVPSPGEESPFVSWSWELPAHLMDRLLNEAEVAGGRVRSIINRTTENGEGPWMIDIVSDTGTVSMDTWSLRSRINEAASIMPEHLPASTPEGRTYPTTVLSPEYSIHREVRIDYPDGALDIRHYWVVEGGGWGHLIGMSQFGAQAMAEQGTGYQEILAHYFGGLTPVPGVEFLPEQVAVGLVIGAGSVSIATDSVLGVTLDGVAMEVPDPGAWRFNWEEGRLVVVPPVLDRYVRPGLPDQPF
ncbi:MAG: SpoIID/LytB domain-containing protein [Acidimicrobiia bacterium]